MTSKKRTSRKRAMDTERRAKEQRYYRKKSKTYTILGIIVIIAIVAIAGAYIMLTSTSENGQTGNEYSTDNPIAVINTTMGTIKVELYEDEMPNTVANFVKLANDGFYNGLIFHRTKDNFMIQGGGFHPDGTHKESPYGTIEFESNPNVQHVDGAISMARAVDPNSASSEFFICDGPHHELDGQYAAFGVTIEGIDVVRSIASTPNDGSFEPSPGGGKPLTDVIINSITIENQ